MRISSKKNYHVKRFSIGNATKRFPECDFGSLPGSDVRQILNGYKYEPEFDMWFSKSGLIGFSVEALD